jgi:uncharacterized protein (DUF2252 family)
MPRDAEKLLSRYPSVAERRARGKALRQPVPRTSHAAFTPAPERPDVVDLVRSGDGGRLEHLLPIKYGRMTASPFAFYRGSAGVMAYDLATTPKTDIPVQLCGDAHVSNFGVFASPERNLVFDINDFDETHPGSWEWDVKRLAASLVVAGRENGFSDSNCRDLVISTVTLYQSAMQHAADTNVLDIWYTHVDTELIMGIQDLVKVSTTKPMGEMLKKAQTRTHRRSLDKLTHVVDGQRRFLSNPPLLVPARELANERMVEKALAHAWVSYKASLPEERRRLLERYSVVDAGRRVGGVGSVGTRCSVVLLQGRDVDDAIVLQTKEAGPSCLSPYFPKAAYANDAERIIRGQRATQAASDIFLGWHHDPTDGRYYYWRQLADMKGSAEISLLNVSAFRGYTSICAVGLARAHARTGDAAMIAGYVGTSERFPEAVADFSFAYADQVARDFEAMIRAVQSGVLPVETVS